MSLYPRRVSHDLCHSTFEEPSGINYSIPNTGLSGSVLTPQSVATLNSNIPLSVNLALAITVYLTNAAIINAAVTAAQTRASLRLSCLVVGISLTGCFSAPSAQRNRSDL